MIDEFFDGLVDRLSESVPAYVTPRWILFTHSAFGWRVRLYFGSLLERMRALVRLREEEEMDLFMRETAERGDDAVERFLAWMSGQLALLARLESRGRGVRFASSLFLSLLAALGVLFTGQSGVAAAAASLMLYWLSVAVESGYAPVAGGVRQTYLTQTLLRSASITLMLVHYFGAYLRQGVPANYVLQGAMVVMLFIHLLLYVMIIAFNKRQPLLLRVLAGVTGAGPALTAAASLALAASSLFGAWPLPLAGAAGALGALMAFFGDQLIHMTHLGGIRLKYQAIWVCLLMTGGFSLMLLGAWTYTL